MVWVLIGNKAAKHQCPSGTGTVSSAPYAPCESYRESRTSDGFIWLEMVHSSADPDNMGAKHTRDTEGFQVRGDKLGGSALFLHGGSEVLRILK